MARNRYTDPWDTETVEAAETAETVETSETAETAEGGASVPRPSRAVRLVDELAGDSPRAANPPRTKPAAKPSAGSARDPKPRAALEPAPTRHSEPEAPLDPVPARQSKPKNPPSDPPAEEDPVQSALCAGITLLSFGDRPARRLLAELMAKGHDRETAREAVARMEAMGCIREDTAAEARIRQGLRKGWGARRIREDLRARGYSTEVIEKALSAALSEVDTAEICASVIAKKYGEVPADPSERRKMTAALLRLGYESGEIREAVRLLRRGE